jgi:hypothetical protein
MTSDPKQMLDLMEYKPPKVIGKRKTTYLRPNQRLSIKLKNRTPFQLHMESSTIKPRFVPIIANPGEYNKYRKPSDSLDLPSKLKGIFDKLDKEYYRDGYVIMPNYFLSIICDPEENLDKLYRFLDNVNSYKMPTMQTFQFGVHQCIELEVYFRNSDKHVIIVQFVKRGIEWKIKNLLFKNFLLGSKSAQMLFDIGNG